MKIKSKKSRKRVYVTAKDPDTKATECFTVEGVTPKEIKETIARAGESK